MSYKRDRKTFRTKVRMPKINFERNLRKSPKLKKKFGW